MLITFILTKQHYFDTFLSTMLDIYISICYTISKLSYLQTKKIKSYEK